MDFYGTNINNKKNYFYIKSFFTSLGQSLVSKSSDEVAAHKRK